MITYVIITNLFLSAPNTRGKWKKNWEIQEYCNVREEKNTTKKRSIWLNRCLAHLERARPILVYTESDEKWVGFVLIWMLERLHNFNIARWLQSTLNSLGTRDRFVLVSVFFPSYFVRQKLIRILLRVVNGVA